MIVQLYKATYRVLPLLGWVTTKEDHIRACDSSLHCDLHMARYQPCNNNNNNNNLLLGSPILPGSAVDQALEQKTNNLKTAISRLSTLQAHDALVILRISLSIPKLMYVMTVLGWSNMIML